jgi:hypothetical protein
MTILLDAANVIEERGLCKHLLEGGRGEVCAVGALNVADHDDPEWFQMIPEDGFIDSAYYGPPAYRLEYPKRAAERRERHGRIRAACQVIAAVLGHDGLDPLDATTAVIMWNNATERTADDVVHTLKLADEYATTHGIEI